MRYTLLYYPKEHSDLRAVHLEPLWQQYFDIEPIVENKIYNMDTCLIWRHQYPQTQWYEPYQQAGYKIVVGSLWENDYTQTSQTVDNVLYLRSPHWFWYNEALWYQNLGYSNYLPQRTNDKFFLMLMRKKNPWRDKVLSSVAGYLDHSLYSYIEKNIFIFNDGNSEDGNYQRYFNPSWYDTTCFSLVIETLFVKNRQFITEKTFKPIAYQHPFVVIGPSGTLAYIKSLGFQTFDHIIDESYDNITDPNRRLAAVIQTVDTLYQLWQKNKALFLDSRTKAILEHNQKHFYSSVITDLFIKEIIEPIIDFAKIPLTPATV